MPPHDVGQMCNLSVVRICSDRLQTCLTDVDLREKYSKPCAEWRNRLILMINAAKWRCNFHPGVLNCRRLYRDGTPGPWQPDALERKWSVRGDSPRPQEMQNGGVANPAVCYANRSRKVVFARFKGLSQGGQSHFPFASLRENRDSPLCSLFACPEGDSPIFPSLCYAKIGTVPFVFTV